MLFPPTNTLKLVAAAAIACLAGCATTKPIVPQVAADVDFGQAETYEVRLSSYDYTPEDISLQAGRPYALKLTNVADIGHDFTAPEFFAAAGVRPSDAAQIADGQIELAPGASATVHLVPAAGTYKLACTHTGHALLGMTGKIVVL